MMSQLIDTNFFQVDQELADMFLTAPSQKKRKKKEERKNQEE